MADKKKKKPDKKKLPSIYGKRRLTQHLRDLAEQVETFDEEGNTLTKGEVLAALLFKKALGWTERIIVKGEDDKVIHHKPEAWAIQYIWDRIEGKAPLAVSDVKQTLTAASKVDELVKARINSITDAVLAIPDSKGPVDLPDNGDESSEGPDEESGMATEAPGSGGE